MRTHLKYFIKKLYGVRKNQSVDYKLGRYKLFCTRLG